jgi:polar amino acid transport system permease protein
MFSFCADPATIDGFVWFTCYVTTGKHMAFYLSFGVVLVLLALAAPAALLFGFAGALACRSRLIVVQVLGQGYITMVRGIPDIAFFLFVPVALDQAFEFLRHKMLCGDMTGSVWRGNEFLVCDAAKLPLGSSPQWVHEFYGFMLALLAFAVVFGAFAGNTLRGAMRAVPEPQLQAAAAFGMTRRQVFWRVLLPQMWVYALPGLSNLWMILVKATPLLFLLGVEDVVYWARELGGSKTSAHSYPHDDWRLWYFLALLVFYLAITWFSERFFAKLMTRFSYGQATLGSLEVTR